MAAATIFLDTNIFLRYLRNDHPTWSPACRELFRNIEAGRFTGVTSPLTISELVFILGSKKHYHQPRQAIAQALLPVLLLRHLKHAGKNRYKRIFALYTAHPKLSYVDCYHAACVEAERMTLYSYDTDFDELDTITRKTPAGGD